MVARIAAYLSAMSCLMRFFVAQNSWWDLKRGAFQGHLQKDQRVLKSPLPGPVWGQQSCRSKGFARAVTQVQLQNSLEVPRWSPAGQATPGCHLCRRGMFFPRLLTKENSWVSEGSGSLDCCSGQALATSQPRQETIAASCHWYENWDVLWFILAALGQ